jgi:hypothetical protein
MKNKRTRVALLLALMAFVFCSVAAAAPYDQVLQRWTKSRKVEDRDGANLTVSATYYSAEFIEALMQSEAQKNLWTESELEDYKYNYLGALHLDEAIPIHVKFVNNGPTMYLGPFDTMIKLRIGNKTYKPIDYDKRFNFKFQGERDGLVFCARYDQQTGKDLLAGVKSVYLSFIPAISPILEGADIQFMWDVANDDPTRLYQGKTAARFESERLLKRLEKIRKDKADLDSQLKAINDEIATIQARLDELTKQ